MHRLVSLVVLLALAGVAEAAPPRPDPTKFGWFTDYPKALAEAKRTGKPIFLVFRCEP